MENNNLILFILTSGANTTLKSLPSVRLKPRATKLALYLSTELSGFLLILEAHFAEISEAPFGFGMTDQVWFTS